MSQPQYPWASVLQRLLNVAQSQQENFTSSKSNPSCSTNSTREMLEPNFFLSNLSPLAPSIEFPNPFDLSQEILAFGRIDHGNIVSKALDRHQ
jgi:hypothetical protein